MKNRLSVATVARLMNVSEQFIRMGLQKGIFPFWVCSQDVNTMDLLH